MKANHFIYIYIYI